MLKIKVKSFAQIREILGGEPVDLEIAGPVYVRSVLNLLLEEYSALREFFLRDGEFSNSIVIAVNGENIPANLLETYELKSGDELFLIPPSGGG